MFSYSWVTPLHAQDGKGLWWHSMTSGKRSLAHLPVCESCCGRVKPSSASPGPSAATIVPVVKATPRRPRRDPNDVEDGRVATCLDACHLRARFPSASSTESVSVTQRPASGHVELGSWTCTNVYCNFEEQLTLRSAFFSWTVLAAWLRTYCRVGCSQSMVRMLRLQLDVKSATSSLRYRCNGRSTSKYPWAGVPPGQSAMHPMAVVPC
jgi:hypothetical protein